MTQLPKQQENIAAFTTIPKTIENKYEKYHQKTFYKFYWSYF